ncbi:unannotated protein [freshwater metagenome]|uniref:Unannotated protein n=1 Tax=freshwater metagenome TaxID=449393 RepID=A0A6J6MN45_9ZZZZ|nr:hypothetical protein [Actinomycetota bacterium]MSY51777.1 hypothetical protein [Actinomycetota bacterium]MSY87475.1 hypothetical protein [Actinomycetota bacterium]MTA50869.1 hypothetical protein [Actinomycetota bacterium]
MEMINRKLFACSYWIRRRVLEPMKNSRGDVPGWVLVVLMTAGLVTVLWAVAGPRLSAMLARALDAVSSQ